MVQETITLRSGKVNEYLHLIDLHSYGTSRMLSAFLGEFDDCSILFDCGSSLDIKKLLKYCRKNNISLSSFKYLITSHHHFDHTGGMWLLYQKLKKHNPNVKILTNQMTKALLNDFEDHLLRGKRTYGDLVGKMRPIEEEAFKIIEPISSFSTNLAEIQIMDRFYTKNSELQLAIFPTPGHTPDHQSSVLINNNNIEFIFLGEAVGTLYHTTKLLTMPVSMPIYYNHEEYMNSIKMLKKIRATKAGFGHFGVVNGEDNIRDLILDHESFMKEFRNLIIKFYNEKPETKYIVNKIMPILIKRTDLTIEHNPVFKGIVLGIVYGMMIDLGYRKA
jgi:glyoxylase-like metal-dependent hydrolase (beta-lactamase superfamily II)